MARHAPRQRSRHEEDEAFAEWVRFLFDKPTEGEKEWYWGIEDEPRLEPEVSVAWTTRLFEECGTLLEEYSDDQCGLGLTYLLSNFLSEAFNLQDESVPQEARLEYIDSTETVYRDLIAARLDATTWRPGTCVGGRLGYIAYMWWDTFPLHPRDTTSWRREIEARVVEVCGRILEIPHDACREGALHGLGHYRSPRTARRAEEIIDAWLARNPRARPELREYARAARTGRVQ